MAPAPRGAHDDLDIPAQRGQPGEEPIGGEASEPPVQEMGDLGLVDAHQLGGGALGEPAGRDDAGNLGREFRFGQPLFGGREPQVGEDVAAARSAVRAG